ncbi:hypothetical protein SAMN05421788_11240 [Filimonas lacunae]|uniref:Uncharacterized protein n=1 Tax=Filimonas lacunae TaxID=477680 RepID=A0A1N7RDC1_9BACT|nr:hypothetical protein SAMN05421788_11240 [Filimonas lacunae]
MEVIIPKRDDSVSPDYKIGSASYILKAIEFI